MANSDDTSDRGYVEQTLLLPRRLWRRIEAMCDSSDKEPSELVADALRLLIAGDVPTSPGPVRGTVPGPSATHSIAALSAATDDIQAILLGVSQEPLESAHLRAQLVKVMRIIEAKDESSEGHSESVAALCIELARKVAIDADRMQPIELGALLHDLGKGQIPGTILSKRGRLTPEEWEMVKRYPELGAQMIADFDALGKVADIVLHHQERWDGSGYPSGQNGEEIPIGAQIVGICDVYHVLTSERAYRPALSPEIARQTILSGVGRIWNPALAEPLLAIVEA